MVRLVGQPKTGVELYELGRKAGLSHETALDVAKPSVGGRRKLSGDDWPDEIPLAPQYASDTTKYATSELLLQDAPMWLRKLGIALSVHPLNPWNTTIGTLFANRSYPLICNVRVDIRAKDSGYINLDMKLRELGGRDRYTSLRVPVGACNAHDTTWVIAALLDHITGRRIDAAFLKDLTLNETDLRHVHGAH